MASDKAFFELIAGDRKSLPKDKDLIGIDPHDSNLSDEMKKKILDECRTNFWYWLEELVRLDTKIKINISPSDIIKFEKWKSYYRASSEGGK